MLSLSAQAGWFKDFCERHLIAQDPYQFEDSPRWWLEEELRRMEVSERWMNLTRGEKARLKLIREELDLRRQARTLRFDEHSNQNHEPPFQ
jgi:hypothetical protein